MLLNKVKVTPPVLPGTVTVTIEGQVLKILGIANGDSGKVTVTLVSGQKITYRNPAADLIRAAFNKTGKK